MRSEIHPTALVAPEAELAEGVRIGPFAVVEAGARIGAGVTIGPHAVILPYVEVGEKTEIHAHAVIGDLPQDTAFKSCASFVRIGANCLIREGVTIHRGTKPESTTEIGDGCFLMANSHVAHNVKLGRGVILANGALLAGYVEVGDRAFISGNVIIHQYVRIGRLAMLSGGCALSKDVPPFCTTHGVTINVVAALNVVGMRRAGMNAGTRAEIKRGFKLLYRSGLNVSEAVKQMKQNFPSDSPVAEMAAFIEASRRGICRYIGAGAENAEEESDD